MDKQKKNEKNQVSKFVLVIMCFILTVCYSCTPKKISYQITDYINNMDIQDDSIHYMNLSKIAPFEWDTLYVFSNKAHLSDVENILKMEYPGIKSVSTSWVFIHDHKIVYYEEIFIVSDKDDNIRAFFNVPDSSLYKIYTNKEFKIEREFSDLDSSGAYIYTYNLSQ